MSFLSRGSRHPGRELIALVAVLMLYLTASALIVAARPAMMRTAVASVDSSLQRDKSLLDSELIHWRDEMLDEGRWVATLTGVLLDAGSGARTATLSRQDIARLQELTVTRIPGARVWVLDEQGEVKASIGGDPPEARQRWLAREALAGDSSVLGATGLRGTDLRIAVASPVRNGAAHGLVVVLDLSAAAQLRHRLPNMTWEGHYGRAAVTFPFGDAFVSAMWSGRPNDPEIEWPRHGWALTDSALIVVSGALPGVTPRFELGMPRSAASARVDSRAAWMLAIAAGAALLLCVIILLVGHLSRPSPARGGIVARRIPAAYRAGRNGGNACGARVDSGAAQSAFPLERASLRIRTRRERSARSRGGARSHRRSLSLLAHSVRTARRLPR